MSKSKEIIVDGIKYIPADSVLSYKDAPKLDGMKYVIVRTQSAGVFAGYLESEEGKEVILLQARRLWYWDGASSLSQLAMSGVSKSENCKFPEPMKKVKLLEAIEIIDCTETAMLSIAGVKVWKS